VLDLVTIDSAEQVSEKKKAFMGEEACRLDGNVAKVLLLNSSRNSALISVDQTNFTPIEAIRLVRVSRKKFLAEEIYIRRATFRPEISMSDALCGIIKFNCERLVHAKTPRDQSPTTALSDFYYALKHAKLIANYSSHLHEKLIARSTQLVLCLARGNQRAAW
jgi:hypothetical protein